MSTEYIIVHAYDKSPQSQSLLHAYYELRARAFKAYWGQNLYADEADALDTKATTTFVLGVENGKVIAGTRLVFHTPGSSEQVKMEIDHPAMALKNMFPLLDAKACSYCEIGALVSDPDISYRSRRLGTSLLTYTLDLIKQKTITNHEKPIDLALYSASKSGLAPIVAATEMSNIPAFVRDDLIQQEENPRFDTKLWPVIIAFNPNLAIESSDTRALAEYRGQGGRGL